MGSHVAICRQCSNPKTNQKPWVHKESCGECVEDFAERHHQETGHQVELNTICIDNILVKRPDTRTNRITGKRGW